MIPAIVLSAHTIGLGVIRALGMMGVPVVSVSYEKGDMGQVSKYVRERMFSPHPEKEEGRFIDFLLARAPQLGGSLLVPADDATLSTVSRHKAILSGRYTVACPEWDVIERIIDKKHTYALAEAMGIPSPKTVMPESMEEVENYGRSIMYPCIVKPCRSHRYYEVFRKKMVRAEDLGQLRAAYKEATDAGLPVMLQEHIPGGDALGVNYNSYFRGGEPLAEFTAEKVRLSPPEFGVPRVVKSGYVPEVIEPGRRLLRALGYYGYSCMEFKRDARDGVYKFMEINGRHNRSSLLSVYCGINFPWIEYEHLTRGELPSAGGVRAGAYWIDEFRDVAHSVKFAFKERYSPAGYIRPYIKPHVFAVWDVRDPLPFIIRLCALAVRGAGRLFGALLKKVMP